MKLNYYSYRIWDKAKDQYFLHDLKPFLIAFSTIKDKNFKNRFKAGNDENVYLFKSTENILLYAMTKSNELVKKIDKEHINIDEIYSSLASGEEVGFASYIYLGRYFYGIATTNLGPRNTSFTEFINDIFRSVGLVDYEFIPTAFLHETDISDVLKMPIIGKTTIEVTKDSSYFKWLSGFFGSDSDDINSFEVIMKPKQGRNICKEFAQFNEKLNNEGIKKYMVRAKFEIDETLTDYYVQSQGAVADVINNKKDNKIIDEILTKVGNNKLLQEKVTEFTNEGLYEKADIQVINNFNNVNSWSDYLRAI